MGTGAASGRLWIALGAVNAFLAVAAGAFAAHGLKRRLSAELLTVFETGARYQMYHALALVLAGLIALASGTSTSGAAWAFLIGIVLFSGSLYGLALSGVRLLGAITPFGGVAFLIGWALLALTMRRP